MKFRKDITAKKLLSLLLAAIVTVTFTPMFDVGAFAADEGLPAGADEELRFVEKLPNGEERELDPEIFTEDGAVINDEMIEALGLDAEPEPEGEELEETDASPASEFDIPSMAAAGMAFPDTLTEVPDEDGAAPEEEAMPEEAAGPDEQGEPAEGSVEDAEPEVPEGGEEVAPPEEAEGGETFDEAPAGDVIDEDAFVPEAEAKADEDIIGGAAYSMSANRNIIKMAATPSGSFNSSMNYSTGIVHVTASISSGYYISNCIVMNLSTNDVVYQDNLTIKNRSYTKDIDMKSCPVGIYVVGVYYRNTGNTIDATLLDMGQFAVSVYLAPSQSGAFEVYSSYISYLAPVFDYAAVSAYKLFMDCGPQVGFGPMNYVQNYTISGLRPDTNYATKIYYGTTKYVSHYVQSNGTLVLSNDNLFFSGKDTGRVRGTGTFRTGKAKLPKIKSIKVKAVKVKARKAGVYGWYTGYYFGKVKYYTYKIKVTVKFKKKPGTKGIYLNGVYRKGNKKTYSKTFGTYAAYSKPRGKKFVVTLYSSQNPSYGGYSPFYSKKKKVS